MVAVLAFGVSVAALARRWEASIPRSEAMDLVVQPSKPAGPADAAAGRDLNVLLLGSDSREGENGQIGGDAVGQRSDTTIVMHVSAGRDRVELVSVPRDSLVDIPACQMADGSTTRPRTGAMVNEAFAIGWDHGGTTDDERRDSAIACAVSTVQASTGLTIDHFVVVDFVGFQSMVDALGGVDICIDQDLKDPRYTGLDLRAGYQRLDGTQALQLARARHVDGGDGMDPSRIGRQQQLLAALVAEALSKNMTTDWARLLGFVDRTKDSLLIDKKLDPGSLAWALRSVRTDDIVLTTIPWQLYPQNVNRVVWTSEADAVWAAMATDTPVVDALHPADQSPPAADGSPGPSQTTPPEPAPALPEQATSVGGQMRQATVCPA